MNSLIPLHVLIDVATHCWTAVITAGANIVLNLLIHPFKCDTVNSILMSIVNTKVGIIALYLSLEYYRSVR